MCLAQGPQRSDGITGVDPGFLKMRVHVYKGVEGSLCWFYLIFLKYPMKMKWFGLSETKLFPFHRIFKNEGGMFKRTPEPHLDWPLHFQHEYGSKWFIVRTNNYLGILFHQAVDQTQDHNNSRMILLCFCSVHVPGMGCCHIHRHL